MVYSRFCVVAALRRMVSAHDEMLDIACDVHCGVSAELGVKAIDLCLSIWAEIERLVSELSAASGVPEGAIWEMVV